MHSFPMVFFARTQFHLAPYWCYPCVGGKWSSFHPCLTSGHHSTLTTEAERCCVAGHTDVPCDRSPALQNRQPLHCPSLHACHVTRDSKDLHSHSLQTFPWPHL